MGSVLRPSDVFHDALAREPVGSPRVRSQFGFRHGVRQRQNQRVSEPIDPGVFARAMRQFGKETSGLTADELRRESALLGLVGGRADLSKVLSKLVSARADPVERLVASAAIGVGEAMIGHPLKDRVAALTLTEPPVGRTQYFEKVDDVLLRLASDAVALLSTSPVGPSLWPDQISPHIQSILRLIYDHALSLGETLLTLDWLVDILDYNPSSALLRRRRPGPDSRHFEAICKAAVDYAVVDFWLRRLERMPEGRAWFEAWDLLGLEDGLPADIDSFIDTSRSVLASG